MAQAHQPGVVVWFTGLSASGKTTLADALADRLRVDELPVMRLDGDVVRRGLNSDLGFSPEDRAENIRRFAELSKLIADADQAVLVSVISPSAPMRAKAREIVGSERFIEVFVDTPLEVCEARDPKDLYRRARAGEIPDFTGVSAPYDVPEDPDVHVKGDGDLGAEAAALHRYLLDCGALDGLG